MRKFQQIGIVVLLGILVGVGPTKAQQIQVQINGSPLSFSGVGAIERSGQVLLPAREVFEALGYQTRWIPKTRTFYANRSGQTVSFIIGSLGATANGNPFPLRTAPILHAGHAMAPLDLIAATGYAVRWQQGERSVSIYTPAASAPSSPPVTERVDLRIDTLTHNGNWLLRKGNVLVVTLTGTPDSVAAFQIGGVTNWIPMAEDPYEVGLYRGRYRVPMGISAIGFPVFGRLMRGAEASPIAQAPSPVRIDSRPPRVVAVAPAPDCMIANTIPNIYAAFDDRNGSGVDPRSVRLLVNGRNVTQGATISPYYVFYTPPLPLSRSARIQVSIADQAGNYTTESWGFPIRKEINGIRSIFHDADQPLRPGDYVTITMTGVPCGQAEVCIQGVADGIEMKEVAVGRYEACYQIEATDPIGRAEVIGTLVDAYGRSMTMSATVPVVIVSKEPPLPPVIEGPRATQIIGGAIIVSGRAEPGYLVRVTVEYENDLSGVYRLAGLAAAQEVIADGSGHFETLPISLSVPPGAGLVNYHIRAVTLDPLGRKSEPTTVSVRRQPAASSLLESGR